MNKTYKLLLIISIFVLAVLCLVLYNYFKYNNKSSNISNNIIECFGQDDYIGNILNKKILYTFTDSEWMDDINNKVLDITLPDIYKLSTIYIKYTPSGTNGTELDNNNHYFKLFSTNKDIENGNNGYKTNNLIQIKTQNNLSLLQFNTLYNNVNMWENSDGDSKYNSKFIRLKIKKDIFDKLKKGSGESAKFEILIFGVSASNNKLYLYDNLNQNSVNNKLITKSDSENKISIELGDNKLIYKLELDNIFTKDKFTNENKIKLSYKNKLDNEKTEYYTKGVHNNGYLIYNLSSDSTDSTKSTIYLDEPILASNLFIEYNDLVFNSSNTASLTYNYKPVTKRDKINFKLRYGNLIEEESESKDGKCPDIDTMIKRQTQALKICESLETSDRIRNVRNSYGKNKKYLEKIAQQEDELKSLQSLINNLIERKNERISNSTGSNVYELEEELKKVKQIREEANKIFEGTTRPDELNLKLNLQPDFKDLLTKLK
jgi:hypothetical protein